jgi:hypothetical protein
VAAHNNRELTDQVISVLSAGGLTVGDAVAPASVSAGAGYVVVYPLTGGTFTGDLDDPFEEARSDYQVTAVGASRKQTDWLSDKARDTLLAATFTLSGRGIIQVQPVFQGGIQRDDDVQPPRFYSPQRFTIWTGPT